MKMNKKNYVAPVAEEILLTLGSPVLVIISGVLDGDEEEAEGDGTEQLGGEVRSDWDNIWVNM